MELALDVRRQAKEGGGMPGSLLLARGLSFRYGKRSVWENLTLDIRPGDVAVLMGENGSGKSTLLRCLAGLADLTEGEVLLLGERFDPSRRSHRAKVAFVSDAPSFYDDMTAREHLRFLGCSAGGHFDSGRAGVLVERFGLSRFLDQMPSSYSRGMRQKLALTVAFASRAQLILLDEPHGPLDPDSSLGLSLCVKEVAASGAAVLMTCHHEPRGLRPNLVLRLANGTLASSRFEG